MRGHGACLAGYRGDGHGEKYVMQWMAYRGG